MGGFTFLRGAFCAPRLALALFLSLAALAAGCRQEPEELGDPHIPLVNPFTGVWQVSGGGAAFREFRKDGTGGDGPGADGPFGNDFSFLVYAGQDARTVPSAGTLVTVSGPGGAADAADAADIAVYSFAVSGPSVTLAAAKGGAEITLTRVSGGPAVLELSNPFVGEWTADWDTGEHGTTWSWKYRADGTAKTLHHQVRHQFENSYIVRGGVLALFGDMRFGYNDNAVFGDFEADGSGGFTVKERQETPAPAIWTYSRVSAAPWL